MSIGTAFDLLTSRLRMETKTQNPNKEVSMRNLFGTAVAAAGLSMMVLPNCCSTANAGVAVSIDASAGYPATAEYGYSNYANADVDWDNAFVINDNRIGMWVWLPVGGWVLRCCNIWYDSGWNEVRFGPWWYDYSTPYTYHYDNVYYNNCPFRTVRFHNYMNQHYSNWHNRNFVFSNNRYQPRTERQIIVNRESYSTHTTPVMNRHVEQQRVPACNERTTVITRHEDQQRAPACSERTTVITRETKQPVRIDGGNRTQQINDNKGNCRQTEVTRTQTTTRNHSDGCGTTTTRTTRGNSNSGSMHGR